MGMKLELAVAFADGTEEVVHVRPVSQVAFERQYKRSITAADGMEHVCWLAWHSLGRDGSFEHFLDRIDGCELVDDSDEDADPLES